MPRSKLEPICAVFMALTLAACTFACSPKNPEPVMQQAYDQSLDLSTVQTLRITKNYPGEPAWSVRIQRKAPGLPGAWMIDSAPISLQDKSADAPFIHHLLDTLKTLRPALEAPIGPASGQGLDPPRAVIEWSETRGGKKLERKLVLGDGYGLNGRFVIFAPETKAVIAGGAFLEMLGNAVNWDSFRMKRLVTWDIDDVDIVRVNTNQFERVGTNWEKEKKDVTSKLFPALENLMHQRIRRFVDDPSEIESIEHKIADRKPRLQIELEDRKAKTERITFYDIIPDLPNAAVLTYAKNSNRVGWYEAYPEALLSWSDLTQAASTPVKSSTKK